MPTNRELYFSLLKRNNKYLNKSVIVSLLMDGNNIADRMSLYASFDKEAQNIDSILNNAKRVEEGEPYQYVLGYSFFLGSKIKVSPDVLIPRQETEQMVVETILKLKQKYKEDDFFTVADICTGSGAIAKIIASEFPKAKVYATDISLPATEIAKENLKDEGVEVLHGDLLEPLIKANIKLDVLICNPPYIGDESTIDEQVWKYEPHSALLASPKTKFYEEIIKNADKVMNEKYLLAFEIGEDMNDELSDIIEINLPGVMYQIKKDIYGKYRFLYLAISKKTPIL